MVDTIYFEPKRVWDLDGAFDLMLKEGFARTRKTAERRLYELSLLPGLIDLESIHDEAGRSPNRLLLDDEIKRARKQRSRLLFAQIYTQNKQSSIHLHDARGVRWWVPLHEPHQAWCSDDVQAAFNLVAQHVSKPITLIAHGELVMHLRQLSPIEGMRCNVHLYRPTLALKEPQPCKHPLSPHLARLESEAIHIIREAVADAERPVMLYSLGKDSSVMLHLARKAFYPGTPPFPLMHIDTRWKFQEMYLFRDHMAKTCGMELIVHTNPEAVEKNINPFDHGSALHTDITKTQGLKQALDKHRFDVIFGGARRDEEKSRAKERIFSFRNEHHTWDPKQQRPELWNLYNTRKNRGGSIRVFPLSNWTELDIWQYIYHQQIPIVPLYFAKARPVVERDGMLMMVDDERFRLGPEDVIRERMVRFRTLGCYPLTGAVESNAASVGDIILELLSSRESERQGRAIDHDSSASMEKKKQAGYF